MFTLHSNWKHDLFIYFLLEKQNNTQMAYYTAREGKTKSVSKNNNNKKKSQITSKRHVLAQLSFPSCKFSWLYSQGGHHWSPQSCVGVHACMCVVSPCPFLCLSWDRCAGVCRRCVCAGVVCVSAEKGRCCCCCFFRSRLKRKVSSWTLGSHTTHDNSATCWDSWRSTPPIYHCTLVLFSAV